MQKFLHLEWPIPTLRFQRVFDVRKLRIDFFRVCRCTREASKQESGFGVAAAHYEPSWRVGQEAKTDPEIMLVVFSVEAGEGIRT